MAFDVTYTSGEEFPLVCTESAATGTVSFAGSATVTVYDYFGNVVLGPVNAVMSAAPAAVVTVYYDLASANLTPGAAYVAVFSIPLLAQDGIARIRSESFNIYVRQAFN